MLVGVGRWQDCAEERACAAALARRRPVGHPDRVVVGALHVDRITRHAAEAGTSVVVVATNVVAAQKREHGRLVDVSTRGQRAARRLGCSEHDDQR